MFENELENQIARILKMFSQLRAIYRGVNYPGDKKRAEIDISFKYFNNLSEKAYNEIAGKILENFNNSYANTILIHEQENTVEMMVKYLQMIKKFESRREAKFFNSNDSTEAERRDFIEFVVGL